MIKRKSKTDNPEADNSHEKLAFFESYFRELYNGDMHRMERIENKSARLLSAISIIIVIVGWQVQNDITTKYFSLFTWCIFWGMIVLLLATWFIFFLALGFVNTDSFKIDEKFVDDLLDDEYSIREFNKHAIKFYGKAIEKNRKMIKRKISKAILASNMTKVIFGCFIFLLLNVLINFIETIY
jgi:hypothetical protein